MERRNVAQETKGGGGSGLRHMTRLVCAQRTTEIANAAAWVTANLIEKVEECAFLLACLGHGA